MKYLNIKIPIEMFREESNNRIFKFLKDFSGDIDLFLLIEPCKQKGYHFTTIFDFTDKGGEGTIITSRRGFVDSDLDLVLHSQKWTPEGYEWDWSTDIIDRLEKNPHWDRQKEAELKEREKYS